MIKLSRKNRKFIFWGAIGTIIVGKKAVDNVKNKIIDDILVKLAETGRYPRNYYDSRNGVRHDFDDIIFGNKEDARIVVSQMLDLITDYGCASIADLYNMVDIPTSFTDNTKGWTDLSKMRIVTMRHGYCISMPDTEVLA